LKDLKSLLKNKQGIMLDIGSGETKRPNFVRLDKRKLPGIDIVWDLESFPYPLPDNCCLTIIGSHIIEHIKPWLTIRFMDELWRIMKPNGQLVLSTPYAGSVGYYQDPTHCNPCNEATFMYFDPKYPGLYNVYRPCPWSIEKGFPVWQANGNLEILLNKEARDENSRSDSK
jgi:SAM-dependent methyltransferase